MKQKQVKLKSRVLCEANPLRDTVLLYNNGNEEAYIFFGDCNKASFVLRSHAYWEGKDKLSHQEVSTTNLTAEIFCTTFSGSDVYQPDGFVTSTQNNVP